MASTDSNSTKNPYFHSIERAPYALGNLLEKLPSDFSIFEEMKPETVQMAKAIRSHAKNARDTLLSGLESIAEALFVAGDNPQNEISEGGILNIATLIKHLAVETQFMVDTEETMTAALHEQEKRFAAKGSV